MGRSPKFPILLLFEAASEFQGSNRSLAVCLCPLCSIEPIPANVEQENETKCKFHRNLNNHNQLLITCQTSAKSASSSTATNIMFLYSWYSYGTMHLKHTLSSDIGSSFS